MYIYIYVYIYNIYYSFLRYSQFFFFGYVEKWLDKKAKLNFKICDVTDWTKNNSNTYIT